VFNFGEKKKNSLLAAGVSDACVIYQCIFKSIFQNSSEGNEVTYNKTSSQIPDGISEHVETVLVIYCP
jgi:hypothetical protein